MRQLKEYVYYIAPFDEFMVLPIAPLDFTGTKAMRLTLYNDIICDNVYYVGEL